MDPLVSVDWLADHFQDAQVVLLDATLPPVGVVPVPDVYGRYLAEHLPNAVFFDIEAFSDHSTSLPHMLPSEEAFGRAAGELGISDSMHLVVYEQEGVFSAARAWWMLRSMGASRVQVLDGGLRAWKEAGHAVTSGPVQRPATLFHARLQAGAVRTFKEVQATLSDGAAQILDARSAGRFNGTAPEPRPGLSSGHMPGAINVPYTALVRDGRLESANALQEVFAAHGVDLQRPAMTTCGSGVTAAVLALGLERCGLQGKGLYDGSWAEYAQHPEAVIVKEESA